MNERTSVRGLLAGMAVVLVLAAGTAACSESAQRGGESASPVFPSLALRDLAGVPASSDRFRGKVLVLNVWATWCAPCRREMPSLARLQQRLDPARYAVVGLALDDDPIAVREFLLQRQIGFPNFVGRDRADVLATLDIRSVPATFVVAADGTLLSRISGPREWDAPDVIATLEAAHARQSGPLPTLPAPWGGGASGAGAAPLGLVPARDPDARP